MSKADEPMKTLYFGFALDREAEKLLACTIRESHADAIEETAEVAGNRPQIVVASTNIARDMHDWLLRNGIERGEAMHLMRQFQESMRANIETKRAANTHGGS